MKPARRRFALQGLAAAALPVIGGCALFEPPPTGPTAPAPKLRVGDQWRYLKRNLYNRLPIGEVTMRVAALEPQLKIEVTDGDGVRLPDERYASPWEVLQEPAWDLVQTFESPCPLLPDKLAPGTREDWQGAYRVPGDSWRYYWSVRVDAHGWEDVTVPAGRFNALRITRRIAFSHQDFRRDESRRAETLWYAPEVNRWVRREVNGSYVIPGLPRTLVREDWVAWELASFSPR